MKKGQVVTLKINAQTITALMIALLFAMSATMVLAITMLSGRAKADNSQTVNTAPGFTVPAGYVLVPASGSGVCQSSNVEKADTHASHVLSALTPYYYNNVITQTINDNSINNSHVVTNSNNSGNTHEHNNSHEHKNNNDNDHSHIHNVNNGSHNGQSGDTNINNEIENIRKHAKS